MQKRIFIDQLKIGMKVEKLNRSWLATPFLRHRFTITSAEQIKQLHASGVTQIDVEVDDVCQDTGSFMPARPAETETFPSISSTLEPEPATTPFAEELPVARQVYKAAKLIIQQAMEDARMGLALNMEAVSVVVESMADSILRNPDALTSLTRLKQFDEYTFFHSVNTSTLALSVGRHLGYERAPLIQLGTGMLLHDIGKTQIPVELLNKPGRYEADEFEIMKQHVLRGAEILSSTTGLTDIFLKPTLEHHERVDGTGYPHRRTHIDLSQLGLIAAIVDIYDAVTSDRCYHKGKTPHDTLQLLYRLGAEGHVDGVLASSLYRSWESIPSVHVSCSIRGRRRS
jgi:putative nucleotidyltransferase with HDIG domain